MTVGDNVVLPAIIGSAVELPLLCAMIGAFGGLTQFGPASLFIEPVIMVAFTVRLYVQSHQTAHHYPFAFREGGKLS